jgi:serine/threonine-protein kinase
MAAPPHDTISAGLVYPQVFGKYVLERELSRGGMARVVLATLRGAGGFEKRLVVKQIRDELAYDSQFVRRFVEEAKTTVALSHPNIVPVYELGVEQGTYFLAMELVEGLSIAELLKSQGETGVKCVLSPEEGAYVGMEVCRALDYAHRRMKVVHRDITPRNVMIDEEGQIKLIDFGIAAPALVAGQEIFGSPGHMPPEQVEGAELGPSTDIFAVAVLLMEAWTGAAPFRRPTPEECDAAMRAPHPRPSDSNARLAPLDDIILRAMKLDPKERQHDAAELGRALRNFLKGVDVGDVARALGDRVREQRLAAGDPEPTSNHGLPRPSMQSAGDLGTKTFAARDSGQWTGPHDRDSQPDAPSTRRVDGVPNPVELESSIERAKRSRGRPDDPAMMIPTPLMVEPTGELPKRKSSRPRAPDKKDDLETIATRPLETPVHRRESASPAPAASRSRGLVAVAAIGIVLAGGFAVWKTQVARGKDGPPPPPTTTTATTAQTTAPAVTTPPSVAPPVSVAHTPTISIPATGATATAERPSASASAEKSGRAQVQLLGDPGTRVQVDGASRGPCPAVVALEPGAHEIRFDFAPTGESRGERVTVKAGERVTVRAQFTGATPTIKIQR